MRRHAAGPGAWPAIARPQHANPSVPAIAMRLPCCGHWHNDPALSCIMRKSWVRRHSVSHAMWHGIWEGSACPLLPAPWAGQHSDLKKLLRRLGEDGGVNPIELPPSMLRAVPAGVGYKGEMSKVDGEEQGVKGCRRIRWTLGFRS